MNSVDDSADSVTLSSSDDTIRVGQLLQLADKGGNTCAAAPKGFGLAVVSVSGASVTFSTDVTAGDASASDNCVITRMPVCRYAFPSEVCRNGVQDAPETGVDCGGSVCRSIGLLCSSATVETCTATTAGTDDAVCAAVPVGSNPEATRAACEAAGACTFSVAKCMQA